MTPEEAGNRRARRKAGLRIGIGMYLVVLAVLAPVLFAGMPAWSLWDLVFTTSLLGGLGSWQSAKGVRRLRLARVEQRLLDAKKPAELPEARIV